MISSHRTRVRHILDIHDTVSLILKIFRFLYYSQLLALLVEEVAVVL